MSAPNEGDIISFKPELDARGQELDGAKPWLVVSSNGYNQSSKLAMVCPIISLSTNISAANLAAVSLPANCGVNGEVLTFQLQTIDWQTRKAVIVGKVPVATLKSVHRNLRMCLAL